MCCADQHAILNEILYQNKVAKCLKFDFRARTGTPFKVSDIFALCLRLPILGKFSGGAFQS